MRVNAFRIGRWLTGILVVLWLAACIQDAISIGFDWSRATWGARLALFWFPAAGVIIIYGLARCIGWGARKLLGIPSRQDFRPHVTVD